MIRRPRLALVAVAGAVALLGSGCGLDLQSLPSLGGQRGSTYPVSATFANVLNLPSNAQVRDGTAVVGRVTSIGAHDFSAEVGLAIRTDVPLPVGTTAQVRFDSPLGDEYILLHPPNVASGGPVLRPGAHLTEASTSTAPSVEDTFAALSAVLNGGGINQISTIVTELNNTFAGNQPQIHALLGQLSQFTTSLSQHTGDIDVALNSIGALSTQLNAGDSTITTAIDAIAPSVTVLAGENGDLHQLLTQLTNLSTATDTVVAQTQTSSVTDFKELVPVVNQLVGVEAQLGPDLQAIASFEHETPKIAPGNYLQVSVNATAVINSAPTVATSVSAADAAQGHAGAGAALLEAGLP